MMVRPNVLNIVYKNMLYIFISALISSSTAAALIAILQYVEYDGSGWIGKGYFYLLMCFVLNLFYGWLNGIFGLIFYLVVSVRLIIIETASLVTFSLAAFLIAVINIIVVQWEAHYTGGQVEWMEAAFFYSFVGLSIGILHWLIYSRRRERAVHENLTTV